MRRQLRAGWTTIRDDSTQVLRLFTPDQRSANLNERSVAVYATDRQNSLLLSGDLGQPGLRQLIDAGLPTPVELLKIPHHGSRRSVPGKFLAHYQPKLAFVSAGHNNRYGFPHQETIQDCARGETPLYRTDLSGTLIFRSTHEGWVASTPFLPLVID